MANWNDVDDVRVTRLDPVKVAMWIAIVLFCGLCWYGLYRAVVALVAFVVG